MKKIIIVGAGQVGATLAESLVSERNEITVIDPNRDMLNELQDKYDLRVIQGNGAHPDVLRSAGADDADMLVAVSSLDEVNMLACQVAHSIFNCPLKIARIRSEQYTKYHDQLFRKEQLPVDHIISPEQLVTSYIKRLIDYPGALQVLEFADGKVSLVAVRASYGGKLVGHAIATLRKHIPNIDTRVAAIFRQGRPIRPLGSTIIEADDEVFFVADTKHIRAVMDELQPREAHYKRVMIVGGGNIGAGLARQLESSHRVKLIELSLHRAEELSAQLDNTLVLHGDASDQQMLSEERIEDIDVFISVTNDDEANIMSALLAKRMGAKKTMVLIQRSAYVDLVQGGDIDIAISPQQATISALLRHIHRSDFANAYSLRRGAAEAIEAVARGDENTSQVVGREVGELKLPPGSTIGAVVRGSEVLIAHDDTLIQSDDHVILFLVDKKYVSEIERLFAPGALYF
ncbi:Trk system potassium transporter TrkA [Aliidiomarina halalkaliphila]|uniref:Trk system potassium uptake protein TrkA n=1 Tax=Aliidiomarina halalkaliphila TaxID=2593535 RepID=A0A552X1E5_9GAMM|nr:Trk system potassium transporter TrkA [Aliidiomarina halalkaliphila]TRW48766.1 Trk system potassium transporter TrkA [Aliidiomarina halalkaliphila]